MNTYYMVISFDEDGGVNAMHRDQFDLGFLGPQKIERASEIKFNETTQLWDIYLPIPVHDQFRWVTSPAAQGFTSYNVARAAEVAWLERAALYDTNPMSEVGLRCLNVVRAEIDGEQPNPVRS